MHGVDVQEPFLFPALKYLDLETNEGTTFVIPNAFLGGSAPLLQQVCLCGIQFPSLPKLLSSTSNLVRLSLNSIPMTGEGHISPDAMTTYLSVLTKLRSLNLTFRQQSSSPYPADQHPTASTRIVLPALVNLWLEGPHGYLEDLVGRVDAPLLTSGQLEFYDEPIFDTPRVPQFLHRSKMFKSLGKFEVYFCRKSIVASFRPLSCHAKFYLSFQCSGLPAQGAIMEQICAQWLPLVSHVGLLKPDDPFRTEEKWWEAVTPWLGFLRPFTTVQTLRLCGMATMSHVAHVLGELKGERVKEVLPVLCTIEVDCLQQGASEILHLLRPFLVTREDLGHPVVVKVGYEV